MGEGWRFKVYLSCSSPSTSSRKISEYIIVLGDMGLEKYACQAWPIIHDVPLTTGRSLPRNNGVPWNSIRSRQEILNMM